MIFKFFRAKNKESNSLKDFRIIIAGNSEANGIVIEIWNHNKLLIKMFRDDVIHEYSISLYKKNLPLGLIEESIAFIKEKVLNVSY